MSRLAPPAAPGIPLAGNALSLAGDVRAYLTREYQRLGPVFRVRAFKRRITVLAGPEANLFLVKDGRTHLRSAEAWRDFETELGAGRAVTSMDGAEHDRMRAGLKRGYSRAAAEQHIPEIVEIVRRESRGHGPPTGRYPGTTRCSASPPTSSASSPPAPRPGPISTI